MKKILILTSVASMILQFNLENIKILKKLNFEIFVICNFKKGNTISDEKIVYLKNVLDQLNVKYFHVNIYRNAFNPLNFFTFFKILNLTKKIKVDVIHSQSPIGGILGRLISALLNLKSIYTAHGFHFYRGSSIMSWFLFFPIEKFLSRITDDLIVMNKEDYEIAINRFKSKYISFIPGIGINNKENIENRFSKNITNSPIKIVSVGELITRKNHLFSIEIVSKLNFDFEFYILGKGKLFTKIQKKISRLKLEKKVHLVGYSPNVRDYLNNSDIFLFTSKQEGLPISLLEAMDEGNICIASNIRGNNDIITNNIDGFLVNGNKLNCYVGLINDIRKNKFDLNQISINAQIKALNFSSKKINLSMEQIYKKYNS